jgi:hypothetical protein
MLVDGRPALTITNVAESLLMSVMSGYGEQRWTLQRPGWAGF